MRCPNCYKTIPDQAQYCEHCGQKQHLPKLRLSHVLGDFFGSLLNIERGLLLTIRMLMLTPNTLFRRFFSGQRVRYMAPVRFFIVTALLSLLIQFVSHPRMDFWKKDEARFEWEQIIRFDTSEPLSQEEMAFKKWADNYLDPIIDFASQYALYLQLINVVLLASIVHWVMFRKRKFNYTELLCICLYLFGLSGLISSILDATLSLPFLGKLLFLGGTTFVFRKKWSKQWILWKKQKRWFPFVAVFMMLMPYFIMDKEALPFYVGLLFWIYYMKRTFQRSFLKSALYVFGFFALYVTILLVAGTGLIYGIIQSNS